MYHRRGSLRCHAELQLYVTSHGAVALHVKSEGQPVHLQSDARSKPATCSNLPTSLNWVLLMVFFLAA